MGTINVTFTDDVYVSFIVLSNMSFVLYHVDFSLMCIRCIHMLQQPYGHLIFIIHRSVFARVTLKKASR